MRRLYTQRPGDVRELREKYHHCEADIPFATRFLIDTGLTGGARAPSIVADYRDLKKSDVQSPARVCMLDIECEDERGFPEPTRDRIICLTAWDSFDDRYTSFVSSPCGDAYDFTSRMATGGLKNGCFAHGKHTICTYAGEKAMLEGFIDYIKKTDPDILSGWNFVDFDMPYITGRMEAIGLNSTLLSRLPGQTERNAVRGRALFDLLSGYKKMQLSERESYRLDAIAEAELGDAKVRYKGGVSDLWKDDPELLVEYNFKDVELCVRINRKNSIIEFYREIARYVGCPLDRTLNSSNVIDIYILRKAHGRYVLPSKGFAAANEFEGATVFDPSRGLRSNVVVLDLKSLYPMAMMTINASPETKDPSGELRAPNGIRFRKEPDGLTRSIIAELLTERDEKKRQRNLNAFGSPEYVLLDLQQNVLKVIMNTYYGVSGYTRFRLYDREIGAAVTSVGRAILEHTRRVIEGPGYTRASTAIPTPAWSRFPPHRRRRPSRYARAIEREVNASYARTSRKRTECGPALLLHKVRRGTRRFFQAGKKKRYAGHLVWKEGKHADEIDVVGFETRRSDYPQIAKLVQKRVMEIKDFLAGKFRFTDPGNAGKVTNAGTINAHSGGLVYLVAPTVENHGVITAPNGVVILAAGKSVELVSTASPDIRVQVQAGGEALNVGQVVAESGRVGIFGAAIRNAGAVSADGAELTTAGTIVLRSSKDVTLEATSTLTANGAKGGAITVQAEGGTLLADGRIEAKGAQAAGGEVKLLGERVGLVNQASVNASGRTGGGTVLLSAETSTARIPMSRTPRGASSDRKPRSAPTRRVRETAEKSSFGRTKGPSTTGRSPRAAVRTAATAASRKCRRRACSSSPARST